MYIISVNLLLIRFIDGFSVIIAIIVKREILLFSLTDVASRVNRRTLRGHLASVRTPPNRGPIVTPPLLTGGRQPVMLSLSLSAHFTPSCECADRPNFQLY